ncbi:CehA/McbA family metallohydrolase [Pseudoroseicyclus tamaricis]|uniref:CehA/McbA family metallohydrolase n=1 Tax=Pseudoroseicyclus tamaricis TaxID=2705421 RepID=A0A6B2JSS0_9RHOB|nr:CehA/McbA family metallohydrolase [Pseudoroseicyclus tamaricis]NDV01075.1 CehA/McbA family metallohydrolase [Pseudoroseicyclus tamaricis]
MTSAPDLLLTASFSQSDLQEARYRSLAFDVPAGVGRLEIKLTYPKSDDCVIDLGLGDPDLSAFPSAAGLVGWSGGARDEIFVGSDAATPGYRPGMWPGRWSVLLGLYRLPETAIDVTVEVRFDRTPRSVAARPRPPEPRRERAGWYRGDLQAHTFHSDARGAPEHLHATALREGLDFLAVTDHNTVTAQQAYFDAASSPQLIFLPAYEFTTANGHANAYGARAVEDFRTETGEDVLGMVRRIRAEGQLFSINHDKPDHPWLWPLPEEVDLMEVWQAPWLAGNHISLARWQRRLAEGRRIAAIGGSDFHQPGAEPEGNPLTLARPCTFLWCEELSEAGLLAAMKAGRSFVTESPEGPRLVLKAGEAMQGAEVPAGPARFTALATGAAGEKLELWDATGCIASALLETDDAELAFDLAPRRFLRAQIVAEASRAARLAEARAWLAGRNPGHADWQGSFDQPLIRALTSPLWVT